MNTIQTANETNTPQEICINEHNGVFLVVAGPGVGKTYTVVKRIQKMIEDGIEPNKILCLTFSDTAAREMKSRIGENISVNVFTYHSFCLNIMEEFPEYFDIDGYKIITDSHKRTLINECIDIIHPKAYNNEKNNPYQYVDSILNGIDEIKKNRIKKEADFKYNLYNNVSCKPRLDELIAFKNEKEAKNADVPATLKNEINALSDKIAKMEELWKFYDEYCVKMKKLGYIDFNDMINMVLDKLEDESSTLLETVAEKYNYVIVDEYQDTNTAQNDIVFNLAKKIDNIFVVGDDDQIIYTFQGAHLDTIEKFLNYKEFTGNKKVNVICFDNNYRSCQNILDLSCSFAEIQDKGFYPYMASKSSISKKEKDMYLSTPSPKLRFISKCSIKDKEGNLLSKKLKAKNKDVASLNKPINFIEFVEKDNERDYIVNEIIKLKEKNVKLSEIAVLTRTNKELKDFATYLKANGVPVEITGGKNIFEINSVNCLISYLQFLTNPEHYSDKMLSFMLLNPYHIDPRDYKMLCDFKSHHDTLINNVKSMIENAFDKEKLKDFIKTYDYLRRYIASENYKNALMEIASKTDILKYYFSEEVNKLENISGFKKLLDVANAYFDVHKNQGNSFKFFVDYLSNLIEGGIEVRLDKGDKPTNAVQLSTYHSSKGREFEYVFMPGLTKGKWESNSSTYKDLIPSKPIIGEDYKDALERQYQAKFLDNIKLLYVGMTRAKHSLSLSYTKTEDHTHGKLSWFIQQLVDNEDLNEILNKKFGYKPEELSENYIIPKYEYDYNKEFKDFVVSKLPNKFSFSGLNTYRNCPKQYFYGYILQIKPEFASMDNASFGTAMHSAFERTIECVMNDKKYPEADDIYNVFCKKLDTLVCDYPENLKKAAKEHIFSNDGYYRDFASIVEASLIDPNKKYTKNPTLDNIATGFYEIYAEYPLTVNVEIEGKQTNLNGFIDRLDKDKNGNYSIYDYKSKIHCSSIAPSDNYFYQMAFYKYVFEVQHPSCKIVNATFLLPLEADNNHKINLIDKFDKAPKNSDKTNYEAKIEELLSCIKGIYNLEFDVPKKPNCDYCQYKQLCQTRTI